jgi:hypothetical protein
MNTSDLKRVLDAEQFDPRAYSLDNGLPNDRVCLGQEAHGWYVYYSDRGLRFDEQMFSTESEACEELLRRLRELPPAQTKRR